MDVGHIGGALVHARVLEEDEMTEALWQEHGWALGWAPAALVVVLVLVASGVSALLG